MPVLIAAGNTELDIVRLLAFRLLEGGGEVRCYLEEDDHELRQEGCKVAVGELTDDVTLEGALTNVHTFIPLLPDPAFIVDESSVEILLQIGSTWASAASRSNIEQTLIPIPSVSRSQTLLGRAYSDIEESFVEACDPLCILLTGWIWGENRPIQNLNFSNIDVTYVGDLVDALAAADDLERIDGIVELGGSPITSRDSGAKLEPSKLLQEALSEKVSIGSSGFEKLGIKPSASIES
jgi:hypothetical protein